MANCRARRSIYSKYSLRYLPCPCQNGSLATAALYELGAVPDARSGEVIPADPLVARQTLETLEMLREKTQGNLTEDERKLIDSLLYDLHMRFVELAR